MCLSHTVLRKSMCLSHTVLVVLLCWVHWETMSVVMIQGVAIPWRVRTYVANSCFSSSGRRKGEWKNIVESLWFRLSFSRKEGSRTGGCARTGAEINRMIQVLRSAVVCLSLLRSPVRPCCCIFLFSFLDESLRPACASILLYEYRSGAFFLRLFVLKRI